MGKRSTAQIAAAVGKLSDHQVHDTWWRIGGCVHGGTNSLVLQDGGVPKKQQLP